MRLFLAFKEFMGDSFFVPLRSPGVPFLPVFISELPLAVVPDLRIKVWAKRWILRSFAHGKTVLLVRDIFSLGLLC